MSVAAYLADRGGLDREGFGAAAMFSGRLGQLATLNARACGGGSPSPDPDPIFAAIEGFRAAQAEHTRLYAICGDLPGDAAEWTPEHVAHKLYWTVWEEKVTKIVPQTAAGIRALVRFVAEFEKREAVDIAEATLAVLANIAASPRR